MNTMLAVLRVKVRDGECKKQTNARDGLELKTEVTFLGAHPGRNIPDRLSSSKQYR